MLLCSATGTDAGSAQLRYPSGGDTAAVTAAERQYDLGDLMLAPKAHFLSILSHDQSHS